MGQSQNIGLVPRKPVNFVSREGNKIYWFPGDESLSDFLISTTMHMTLGATSAALSIPSSLRFFRERKRENIFFAGRR